MSGIRGGDCRDALSEWVIGEEIVPEVRNGKRVGNSSERKPCRNEHQIEGGAVGTPGA